MSTFIGLSCNKCGTTEKYESSRSCVKCAKANRLKRYEAAKAAVLKTYGSDEIGEKQATTNYLAAADAGHQYFMNCMCNKCGTNSCYTVSRHCVNCARTKSGETRKRSKRKREAEYDLATASFKKDIKYQAWI